MAERTLSDYMKAHVPLKVFFGGMAPGSVQTKHVTQYITAGRNADRAVRANRERAALSSCMGWMVSHGHADLKANPCRGARRNTETKRDRCITYDEYANVVGRSSPPVRAWMELVFRTLQRPSDVLKWTQATIVVENGQRLLFFRQAKTKTLVKIVVTEQLQEAFDNMAAARKPGIYLICRRFRRHVEAAGLRNFGIYDLKGKGATDMYNEGTPLSEICALCAHDSERTTEIYI